MSLVLKGQLFQTRVEEVTCNETRLRTVALLRHCGRTPTWVFVCSSLSSGSRGLTGERRLRVRSFSQVVPGDSNPDRDTRQSSLGTGSRETYPDRTKSPLTRSRFLDSRYVPTVASTDPCRTETVQSPVPPRTSRVPPVVCVPSVTRVSLFSVPLLHGYHERGSVETGP